MSTSAFIYLGMTFGLFIIFAAIVAKTYRKSGKEKGEAPKYRMLDEDE